MVALTAYVNFDAATLAMMKTQAEAEMGRQMVAGQNFAGSGKTRGGINFEHLAQHLSAINYAQKYQSGDVQEMVVGDLSGGPL